MNGPSLLEIAIEFAVQKHAGQVDKAGEPYILHPLRVMLDVHGEERRIAAVLHDVVEDCGVSTGTIGRLFGDRVADAVDALSRRKGESYAGFIERCGANEIARDVKAADLRDNMDASRLGSLTAADHDRMSKYRGASSRLAEIARAATARA